MWAARALKWVLAQAEREGEGKQEGAQMLCPLQSLLVCLTTGSQQAKLGGRQDERPPPTHSEVIPTFSESSVGAQGKGSHRGGGEASCLSSELKAIPTNSPPHQSNGLSGTSGLPHSRPPHGRHPGWQRSWSSPPQHPFPMRTGKSGGQQRTDKAPVLLPSTPTKQRAEKHMAPREYLRDSTSGKCC